MKFENAGIEARGHPNFNQSSRKLKSLPNCLSLFIKGCTQNICRLKSENLVFDKNCLELNGRVIYVAFLAIMDNGHHAADQVFCYYFKSKKHNKFSSVNNSSVP